MAKEQSRTEQLIDQFLGEFLQYDVLFLLEIIGITFIALALIEVAWDYYRGKRKSVVEPLANFSFHIVTQVLNRTIYGLIVVIVFVWAEQIAAFEIPVTWWSWCLCFLLADFSYYWMHRAEHRVRLFWTLHSVHHSSEEYDLSTSFRIFWLIDFTLIPFFLPMVLIGFAAPQVLACMLVVFTYMIWVHTEKIGSLGWFDKFFSSPSVHRVHHGSNPQYLDKNYAGVLLIWDRMFGTHEPEAEPVRYGLTTPIETSNPVKIGFHELGSLVRDLRRRPSWKDKWLTLIRPPGWKPDHEKASTDMSNSGSSLAGNPR